MRRRTALAALTGAFASLAGCNELGSGPGRPTFGVPTTGTAGPSSSVAFPSEPPADPTVGAVSTVGTPRNVVVLGPRADTDLSFTVGFTRGGDAESPVRLWVGATNTRDGTYQYVFDGTVPFGGLHGTPLNASGGRILRPVEDGPGLWLVPLTDPTFDDVLPDSPGANCWHGRGELADLGGRRPVSLDGGETVGQEFALVTPRDGPSCLPEGIYRFESDWTGLQFVLSLWNPTGTDPSSSGFADVTVPGFERSEVRWFHEARSNEADVYLAPSAERVEAPTTVEFTLYNYGRTRVSTDSAMVYRLEDGEWRSLIPNELSVPGYGNVVYPGQTASVSVGLGTDDGDESLPALRPGRYAVRWGHVDQNVLATALVDVADAPPIELAPTEHVGVTARSDGTLFVKSTRSSVTDDARGRTLRVRRTDGGDAPRLLVEHVASSDGLRNTVPFLEEDDALGGVLLRTSGDVTNRALSFVRSDDRSGRFSFRGETYEATETSQWVSDAD